MAIEVLVRAVTNDASIPRRSRWTQGDIVCVKQSPAVWGNLETLAGGFWRITIEGIDLTDPRVQAFLEIGDPIPFDAGGGNIVQVPAFRRKRFINTTNLPNALRNALASTGTATIRANQLGNLDSATVLRTT